MSFSTLQALGSHYETSWNFNGDNYKRFDFHATDIPKYAHKRSIFQ